MNRKKKRMKTMDNEERFVDELSQYRMDLVRLTLASYTIADELHMIRRALEGEKGEYNDPIYNTFANYGLEEHIEP